MKLVDCDHCHIQVLQLRTNKVQMGLTVSIIIQFYNY